MYTESADLDAYTRNSLHMDLKLATRKKNKSCLRGSIRPFKSGETNSEFIIPAYSNKLLKEKQKLSFFSDYKGLLSRTEHSSKS